MRFYPNNTTVVQAVGRGDVEVGLVNHYYLYNLLAPIRPTFRCATTGSATATPATSCSPRASASSSSTQKSAAAQRFVDFLLSKWAQRMIARGPGAAEYPLVKGVPRRPGPAPRSSSIKGPKYILGRLSADLAPAVRLLLEEGYIR